MAKGIKTGGRQKEGVDARDKLIRVSSECKPDVERFRNLLDNPDMTKIAISFLNELESMSKESKKTTN